MKLKLWSKIILAVLVLSFIIPATMAAEVKDADNIQDLLPNPVTGYNGLGDKGKSTFNWVMGLVGLAMVAFVIIGYAVSIYETSVGKKTQNADMSATGTTRGFSIILMLVVFVIGTSMLIIAFAQ